MQIKKSTAGKILYATLFLAVIPAAQWLWSTSLDTQLGLAGIHLPKTGAGLLVIGFFLMAWAMFSLKKYGKGLPMNAYPPTEFVKKGPYAWVRHPIYWGYGLVMNGVALYTGSGAAIRIVVPLSILSMAAIVLGYEGIFLREKFKGQDSSVLLDIPAGNMHTPAFRKRLTVLLRAFSLLLLSNLAYYYLRYSNFTSNYYPALPLLPEEIAFLIIYLLFIFLPVMLLPENNLLRQWTISFIIALSIINFRMLFWSNKGNELVGQNVIVEYPLAFLFRINAPSVLLLISGSYWIIADIKRKLLITIVGTGLILFTFYAYRYSTEEIAFTILTFVTSRYYKTFWKMIRDRAEQLANSWKEWTVGPVRIFSHSIYVGLGGFLGIFASGMMAGKTYAWAILIITIIVVVCAALWAQLIEGSDQLKRPFGYYGAVAGILVAGMVLRLLGYEIWSMIGAISVLMPWIQAAGRLRCLVNGCCHGSITENEQLGIRYFHPRSRVCSLSDLKGKLLHPTPVYSILWLFITGMLLIRLWQLHFGYAFLFGLYLILTSLGRFVEEAYRGEVQTPVWNRLRLYQWVALSVLVAGIGFTNLDMPQKDLPAEFGWEILAAAFIGGFFTFFAMGVDFPRSNARFSRLV